MGVTSKQPKLPVLEIISMSISKAVQSFYVFLYPLLIISVAILLFDYGSTVLYEEGDRISLIVYLGLFVFLHAVFAIICHRIVILGRESVPKYGYFRPTVREIKYAAWVTIAYFTFFAAYRLISWISIALVSSGHNGIVLVLIPAVVTVTCIYFLSRFSLVLPSTAIERSMNPMESYRLTKSNGWRILFIVMILPALLGALVSWVPEDLILLNIVVSFIWLFLYVVEVSALSFTYVFLAECNENSID